MPLLVSRKFHFLSDFSVKTYDHLKFFYGHFDGRRSNITTTESQPPCHIGPITRAMARKLEEDWNTVTDCRETYLYMLKDAKFVA